MRRVVSVRQLTGLLLVVVAIALYLAPELANRIGFATLLRALENGYFVVAIVAGFGIAFAILIGMTWWLSEGNDRREFPTVETLPPSAVPGIELDDAVAELVGERGRAARPVEHRELIRERLIKDAVRTVRRVENVSLADARARVEAGTWTDNRYAVEFLGDDSAPSPRWYQRAFDRLRRRDPFARRVYASVEALNAMEPGDR